MIDNNMTQSILSRFFPHLSNQMMHGLDIHSFEIIYLFSKHSESYHHEKLILLIFFLKKYR